MWKRGGGGTNYDTEDGGIEDGADDEMDCVFIENALNVRYNRHMCIECIPMPKEIGEMAPIYFKVINFTILCVINLHSYFYFVVNIMYGTCEAGGKGW